MNAAETMLVVGADGTIGRALAERFSADGYNVVRTTRMTLDLAHDAVNWTPPPARVAILCAAITSQEKCRQDPAASRAVNVEATLALAEKLIRQGTHVVFPSTNFVLSGLHSHQAADEPYAPRTEYARQKAEVEQRLRQLPGTCVVRFTKIFGCGVPLLRAWCEALHRGQPIRPFSDMPMAPVPLEFAAKALAAVATARAAGIVQVSAAEDITYAAAARFMAQRLGAGEELV
jgi:dTDP-4-dehydrorhamnose reductase